MTAILKEDWKTQFQPLSKEQHDGSHQSGADNSDQKTFVGRQSSRNLEAREKSKATATHMTLNKKQHTDSYRNISQRNLEDRLPKRNSKVKKRNQLLEESAESLLIKQRDIDAQLSLIRTSGRASDRQISDSGTDLKKEIRNSDGKSSNGKTKERERKLSVDTVEKLDIRRTLEHINSTNSLAANSRKERSDSSDKSIFRVAKSDNDQTRSGSVTATKVEFNNSANLMGTDEIQIWEKQSRKEAVPVETQARKRASRLSEGTGQTIGIEVNKAKNDAERILYLGKESVTSTSCVSDDFEITKRNADPKENTGKRTRGTMKVTNDGSYGMRSEKTKIDNDTKANSHDLLKRQRKIKPEVKKEDAEVGMKEHHLEQKAKIKEARSSGIKTNGQIMMQNQNDGDDVKVNPKNTEKKLRIIGKTEMLINKRSLDVEKKHDTNKVKMQKDNRVSAVAISEDELAEKGKQTSKLSKDEAEGKDMFGVRREILRSTNEAQTCRHEIVNSQSSEHRMELKGVMKDVMEEHHSEPVRKIRRSKDAEDKLKKVIVEEHGLNETICEEKHSSEKNKDKDVKMEHSSVNLKMVDLTEEQKFEKNLRKTKLVRNALGLENQTKVKHTSKDILVASEMEVRMMKKSETIGNMNGDATINQKMARVNAAKDNWNLEEKLARNDMLQSLPIEPELAEVLISKNKAMKLDNSLTRQRIGNTVKVKDARKVPAKELMMKELGGDPNMNLAIGKCFLASDQISASHNITEETGLARCGLATNPLDNHQLESLASGSQNFEGENVKPSKMNTTGSSKEAKSFVQNLSLCERKDSETKRSKERYMHTECDNESTSRSACDNESTSSDEIVEDIQIMDCDDSQWNGKSEQKMLRPAYNLHATTTGYHGPCIQTKRERRIITRKEIQKVARKLEFGSEMLLPVKTVLSNYPESIRDKMFGKRHLTPIAFDVSLVSKCIVEASLKQSRARVTKRVQRRFQDLRQIIEFDVWSTEIFHLLPLTEYALYMRIYGMSNTRQAFTQTGEDNISTEVQTDDVHLRSKWCQHPDHPGIERYERDLSEVTLWNSERLSKFLLNAGKVMKSLLEETAFQHLDFTQCSSPETAAFSDGCIELGLVSFLKDRHVISGQFSSSESQFLLLVYSQPTKISEDEKLSRKGIICLWNLTTPEKPLKVMVSEAEPQCCCLSPSKPTVAFAGMNDGTLSVWDMRESSFLHLSYYDNTEEWVLRRPTFNTVAVLNQGNHSSPVVSVAPILGPSGHRGSRQDTGIPIDGKEECLAFQLASLEIDAVIVLWVVTEMKKPKEVSSEADFCLSAGGRIRLTKTRMIALAIPIIRTKCFSHCQKVFKKPFHALSLQLLPYSNPHYYVTTDVGCILHGLSYEGRTNPSVHFYKLGMFTEVSGFDFCPFDQSYFLAGHQDGSVCLYTTQQVHPVVVWRNTTKNDSPILAIHFSRSRPGTFFVLDDNSYLYTWNLLESTDSPVNQEHLSHSRVTHVCLSTHTKFTGNGLECRQPYMAIFTESGTCSIRKFSERLSNFSSSDVDDFKLKLTNIS